MGRTATSRRQLPSWQRTEFEEKRKTKRGDPPRSVREGEMLTHKHTVALLGTHGTSAAASGRADSWQLRFVFASWESWHCHFINYLWLLLALDWALDLVNRLATQAVQIMTRASEANQKRDWVFSKWSMLADEMKHLGMF
ncbi:Cytochrome P450 monooxygenase radP [Dissostichus eleginoides]|uniref:Cytochrome P450 monooxygenase radP n=1 Tax=Dissostichus eleginoides TaxID=100907 RepID=A0AAD9BZ60_DISEL|nr:Cytochrome P450 monooxygenase radP [Dissostichus eleginoides]